MKSKKNIVAAAFPVLVLVGLILAIWGLVITPEEIHDSGQIVRWQWGVKNDSSIN